MSYRVETTVDGITQSELGPIVLEHDGKFEQAVGFTMEKLGEMQRVEFLLYNQRQSSFYLSVHLLIDVEG